MVLQRLALGLLTLFIVSIIIFASVELLPGDLAEEVLGQGATQETVAAFRRELGLDRPPIERYLAWLGGVATGDFGTSLANRRDISELIGGRLANTLFLAGYAALMSVPLALGLGILAALYRNTLFDRVANAFTLTSISFPKFFVAYILILFLAVRSGVFPSISRVARRLAERTNEGTATRRIREERAADAHSDAELIRSVLIERQRASSLGEAAE